MTSAVLVALLLGGTAGVALAPPAVAAEDGDPLLVTLDTLTPAVLPRAGTVEVTGTISNDTDEDWSDLKVYLVHSRTPIGDAEDLAAAAVSDPGSDIGERLALPGQYQEVGDLAPGESTTYRLSLRRREITTTDEPGVYWLGVHVLGTDGDGRDGFTDGRARTFVPLIPRGTPRTEVAVVLPLVEPVLREPDGRLDRPVRWKQLVSRDGRLSRLLDLAGSSPGMVTWVVDPAVLEAVDSLARGNPGIDSSPDGSGPGETGDPSATASPTPSTRPSTSPSTNPGTSPGASGGPTDDPGPAGASAPAGPDPAAEGTPGEAESPAARTGTPASRAAARWLDRFRAMTARSQALALPYGDPDLAAVTLADRSSLLREAQRQGVATLNTLGIAAEPVLAPPSGYLPARSLARLGDDVPLLLGDDALPDAEATLVSRSNGLDVLLADSATLEGGPGPNNRIDLLAVRQRLLAEAAVRSVGPDPAEPLVVALPPDFDPGPDGGRADFFAGLDQPWIEPVDLGRLLALAPGPVDSSKVVYPLDERRAVLPVANLDASRSLISTGRTFAHLLTDNDDVQDQLARQALLASSYAARDRADRALTGARSTRNRIRLRMEQVSLDGPGFVMMSSDTGPISVSVTNGLDETVTIRVQALGDAAGITVDSPGAITLAPDQRTAVLLQADASRGGVRSVTLRATTEQGDPVGRAVRVDVRTSNVGVVIWVVMAAGGALFLLAVAARLRRRRRDRRLGPDDEALA